MAHSIESETQALQSKALNQLREVFATELKSVAHNAFLERKQLARSLRVRVAKNQLVTDFVRPVTIPATKATPPPRQMGKKSWEEEEFAKIVSKSTHSPHVESLSSKPQPTSRRGTHEEHPRASQGVSLRGYAVRY